MSMSVWSEKKKEERRKKENPVYIHTQTHSHKTDSSRVKARVSTNLFGRRVRGFFCKIRILLPPF